MIQPQASVASMRHDEAMRFLSQRSGKQFDPGVIEIISQFAPVDVPDSAIIAAEDANSFGTEDFEPEYVDAVLSVDPGFSI